MMKKLSIVYNRQFVESVRNIAAGLFVNHAVVDDIEIIGNETTGFSLVAAIHGVKSRRALETLPTIIDGVPVIIKVNGNENGYNSRLYCYGV